LGTRKREARWSALNDGEDSRRSRGRCRRPKDSDAYGESDLVEIGAEKEKRKESRKKKANRNWMPARLAGEAPRVIVAQRKKRQRKPRMRKGGEWHFMSLV